jgi:hypothetical protein
MDKKQLDILVENFEIRSKINSININIVINAKFLFAKEKLQENPWYFFKIKINRKNQLDSKLLEQNSTNWIKLKEGQIDLDNQEFV